MTTRQIQQVKIKKRTRTNKSLQTKIPIPIAMTIINAQIMSMIISPIMTMKKEKKS